MNAQQNLGIFANYTKASLYVVGDDILLVRPGRAAHLQKVASLRAWVKALAQHVPRENIVARAKDHIARMSELEFCLCKLLPYLKFLATGQRVVGVFSPGFSKKMSLLRRQSSELAKSLTYNCEEPLPLEQVLEIFQAPCIVTKATVIPLELISMPHSGDRCVMIRGVSYRQLPHRARSLRIVVGQVERAVLIGRSGAQNAVGENTRAALEFLRNIEELISLLGPVNCGCYQVIYKDRYHELQYSQGHFVLVRGPVKVRKEARSVYVGLHISGRTRADWLKKQLCAAVEQQGFWKGPGIPVSSGMCMGSRHQYQHLLLGGFTDASALVQWLDAGVDRATRRSDFHRKWRAGKLLSLATNEGFAHHRKVVLSRCTRQTKVSQLSR